MLLAPPLFHAELRAGAIPNSQMRFSDAIVFRTLSHPVPPKLFSFVVISNIVSFYSFMLRTSTTASLASLASSTF